MKVDHTVIFLGDHTRRERNGVMEKKAGSGQTVFAGNWSQQTDPIAQKRQQAQKKAMKVVTDAWAGEQKIDTDMEERRQKIKDCRETIGKAKDELREIEKRRGELREAYGVGEDSAEEQELKLLEKEINANKAGSNITLTEEEYEQLAQIKSRGLTEYQQRSLDMKNGGSIYETEISEANRQIVEESAVIRATRIERLKSQTMLKAQQSADEILDSASDEIIGMLIEEAKEHIDEEMEEKKEAAEEKAEKKEEQEERIKEQKETKEEKEAYSEEIADATEFVLGAEDVLSDIQKEIKKIMEEMKLVEEDIKGAAVDTIS